MMAYHIFQVTVFLLKTYYIKCGKLVIRSNFKQRDVNKMLLRW